LVETIDKNGYARGHGENFVPVKIKNTGLAKNSFYIVNLSDIEMEEEPVLIGTIS
jgi:hypothetical protein